MKNVLALINFYQTCRAKGRRRDIRMKEEAILRLSREAKNIENGKIWIKIHKFDSALDTFHSRNVLHRALCKRPLFSKYGRKQARRRQGRKGEKSQEIRSVFQFGASL